VRISKSLFATPGIGSKHSTHLLSGFLRCGVCGAPMTIVRVGGKYGCSDYYTRGNCDNARVVSSDHLEQRLFAKLQGQVLTPEVLDYIVEALKAASPVDNTQKRLSAVEAELSRLADAIAATGPTPALLTAINQREEERRTLAARRPAERHLTYARGRLHVSEICRDCYGRMYSAPVANLRDRREGCGWFRCRMADTKSLAIGICWDLASTLRGVDLNHRPLGYEFNISFGLVRSVRKRQQLSNGWFRLLRVVLGSHVRNLFAISCFHDHHHPWVSSTVFSTQHRAEVGR